MDTTVKALKNLYVALGGNADSVKDINKTPDAINAIAGYVGIADTGVHAEKGSTTLFGTKVSAMQTNLNVAEGAITGTLKFIAGGLAQSGPLAGDGNFMALQFVNEADADSIKVGLVPSASGMDLVEVVGDPDMNGVFKVSGEVNGVQQVFKVVTTKNGVSKTQIFDLSDLDLNTEA